MPPYLSQVSNCCFFTYGFESDNCLQVGLEILQDQFPDRKVCRLFLIHAQNMH